MNHLTPIFAAGWGELVVVLIFFIISALGQLLSAKNKPARPRPARPLDKKVPPQGQDVADKLRSEVDDFLREMQGKPPRPKQPPKKPRVVVSKVEKLTPPQEPANLRKESVLEHVTKHISTAEISQHSAKLGEQVGLADERMESHLKERFSHRLGSFETREQVVDPKRKNLRGQDIADLLRSPAGMRQAIILSEILRRPEI